MHCAFWQLGVLLLSSSIEAAGGIRRPVHRQLQTTTTVGQVENLRFVNADTDKPILNLTNNLVINLYSLNTSNFSIQATTTINSDAVVGSIRFAYNGNSRFRTDSVSPFSMCPTAGGRDYQTCTVLSLGVHNVTATPFENANATGMVGIPYQVTFQIVNVSPTPAPNVVRTSEPTRAPIISPTNAPIVVQTTVPTKVPIVAPMTVPTSAPIMAPITVPTNAPIRLPTSVPTKTPIVAPTSVPTNTPITAPTSVPTKSPTTAPTTIPNHASTSVPTSAPINGSTSAPTTAPPKAPTSVPSSSCQVPQVRWVEHRCPLFLCNSPSFSFLVHCNCQSSFLKTFGRTFHRNIPLKMESRRDSWSAMTSSSLVALPIHLP
jgi:hypothetical protein